MSTGEIISGVLAVGAEHDTLAVLPHRPGSGMKQRRDNVDIQVVEVKPLPTLSSTRTKRASCEWLGYALPRG